MAAENPTTENWLPVVDFQGRYEVSDLGRVRSLTYRWGERDAPRFLSLSVTTNGYLAVGLYSNARCRQRKFVHRLVAAAFCQRTDQSHTEVNHINFIKTDNRAENLEWCTTAMNAAHTTKNGRYATGDRNPYRSRPELVRRGERHHAAKLAESDVRTIRAECASGTRQRALARKYGTSAYAVYAIVHRKTWKHVA